MHTHTHSLMHTHTHIHTHSYTQLQTQRFSEMAMKRENDLKPTHTHLHSQWTDSMISSCFMYAWHNKNITATATVMDGVHTFSAQPVSVPSPAGLSDGACDESSSPSAHAPWCPWKVYTHTHTTHTAQSVEHRGDSIVLLQSWGKPHIKMYGA